MSATRWIVLMAFLAGLAGLAYWAFQPQPVPVDLDEATRGPLQITVDADGKTRIRDVYEVAAPIAGQALRSPVAVGDRVIAGKTVVAVVRPVPPALLDERSRQQAEAAVAEAVAALAVASSQVRQAEEDLTHARSQFTRTATLVDRGVASASQLEDVSQVQAIKSAALDGARFSHAMAEGALARARAVLIEPDPEGAAGANGACCVELHAPTGGVVLAVENISERPVVAGAPLLSVGQPDNLEIVADLLSSDAVRIAPGSRAIVERWGGNRPLEAIVRKIEPSARTKVSALGIEEQRVDVVLELVSRPGARLGLGDGYAVYLRIVEWQSADVLRVPVSALFRDGDGWAAFVALDGVARKSALDIGRRNGRMAEVLSGLEAGDMVVTHPGSNLADGASIIDRRRLE